MTLHQKRILSAEAALLPPESVAKWLEQLIPDESHFMYGGTTAAHEIVLLRRDQPLIDLALARYGVDERVLRRVFNRGNSGVHCAALANRFVGPKLQGYLFASGWLSLNQFNELIKRGTKPELSALLQNEFIEVDVLEWLFRRERVFSEVKESRWQLAISFVAGNPRLEKKYEGPMDGWAEYRHNAYAQYAWELSSTVPVTESWATILLNLYAKLPLGFRDDWISSALQRWEDDPERADPTLSNRFWLRSRIADLAKDRSNCRDSGDLALRLSFYRLFVPENPTELQTYYDKDKTDFLDEALRNRNIFVRDDLRTALQDLCWNEGKGTDSLDYANSFNSALEYMGKNIPGIIDNNLEPESNEMLAIQNLQEEIGHMREDITALISAPRKKWF